MTVSTRDIAILGSGPAALAIGSALARLGCDITVIAPNPRAAWEANYCLWADELPEGAAGSVERTWGEVVVATPRGEQVIARPYAKLDGHSLADSMWRDLDKGSARVIDGRAVSVRHHSDASSVLVSNDVEERARVVIDASGAESPFVARNIRQPAAFQIAYGVLLDARSHPFDPSRAVLMDFRPADADDNEPPSFLYALPLRDGRLFVEETSLAHRPAVSFELLRSRLQTRLIRWRLADCEVLATERCRIPMGVPLPEPRQHVVPFGAAASMVNPASGYSIAHALRKAEPAARAIAHALATSGREEALAAGNTAVWPSADRAAWALYAVGLESLVAMTSEQTSAFFAGFFQMPQADWSDFLAGTLSAREVGRVMARVFRFVPPSVGWHLVWTSVSTGAAPLAKAFLQPGTA
jgi:lycopene cyclase-like protein